MTTLIKIFVRLWWLNDIEIKNISDKKDNKIPLKKIKWKLLKKLNGTVQKNKIKLNGKKKNILKYIIKK